MGSNEAYPSTQMKLIVNVNFGKDGFIHACIGDCDKVQGFLPEIGTARKRNKNYRFRANPRSPISSVIHRKYEIQTLCHLIASAAECPVLLAADPIHRLLHCKRSARMVRATSRKVNGLHWRCVSRLCQRGQSVQL